MARNKKYVPKLRNFENYEIVYNTYLGTESTSFVAAENLEDLISRVRAKFGPTRIKSVKYLGQLWVPTLVE